ncbi:NmrA family NAD(P)-binding protein [Phytohabitans kaempferiae]|uniref:NAD(P)H-binding protein n=1 Tax=Phytohabitans kaempferiae TaxID=1620943 RepID=A0ABV6MA43_9ACTN
MTASPTILVTGSTGNTGRPLVTKLLARGVSVRAASRHPTPEAADGVRFDWYDPATFDGVLAGVDAAYLVPPPLDPDPQVAMAPFLATARQAGVSRMVLLGSSAVESGGPAVGQVAQLVSQMFEEWVVLRPSWFMQNFVSGHHHAESARTMGKIVTATGQGRVAFIDVEDIAEVAAHALVAHEPLQGDLILTGPEALSYADVAATLTEVLARPVRHDPVTTGELEQMLAQHIPEPAAAMLASIDQLLALGIEDRTTDTVERVTGRPPRSLKETLRVSLTG